MNVERNKVQEKHEEVLNGKLLRMLIANYVYVIVMRPKESIASRWTNYSLDYRPSMLMLFLFVLQR